LIKALELTAFTLCLAPLFLDGLLLGQVAFSFPFGLFVEQCCL
jgi:hypothetical protein